MTYAIERAIDEIKRRGKREGKEGGNCPSARAIGEPVN
jgi:hypothetical protein